MTDPGALKSRLVLEAPVETDDGAGGVVRTYAAVATLWAQVRPAGPAGLGGRATVEADALAATVTHRILIRLGPEVTIRHRLRDGARIFRIVAVRDPTGEARFLEIHAEERRD